MALEEALAYARAGLPVFPVRADKSPLTPHGFKDATTDETRIRELWTWYPDAGIGMPTGAASGVVVLDVDPRNGGEESMERLIGEHGVLPRGPVARTGGGGEHRWFQHPGGTVPPSHGFRPGLDLQGDGSYVILPPSPHLSGRRYEWVVPLGATDLPLLPPWLLKLATETAVSGARRQFEATPDGLIPHGRHHDYIVQAAASRASRFAGWSEANLVKAVTSECRDVLDDTDAHAREIADAVRSAIGKYGRPASPSDSTRTGTASPSARGDLPNTSAPGGPQPESRAAEQRVETPIPDVLFTAHPKTGVLTPSLPMFLAWFRNTERFIVPVEHGTFSTPSAFEMLRYEGGYYNGMARAYVRRRVEDAHRLQRIASRDAFREEVVKGIAATSEFHRRRETFNPPDLLCLRNGVLDTRTGEVRPHSPDAVFTWRMPVDYVPGAMCPTFAAFLERVMPDERRRDLVVDLMGYCLWRRNPFQAFFVNVGDGANGKTTWLRVMEELLGQDAIAAESLQNLSSQRFAPAELEGKLANLCDDLPFDRPLAATGVLKILTGEGEFTGERKFLPKFKFRFDGKLVANANRTPEVRDDTYAFWRRLVVIPWEVVVPAEDRDPLLIDKLRAELPGILNLALRGLARCRGRDEFDPGGVFEGSKEEWHRRADPIRAWLLEDYEASPAGFVPHRDLYVWYLGRCEAEGAEPIGDKAFEAHVTRAFPRSLPERRHIAGKAVRGRPGITRRRPRPDQDEESAAAARRTLEESLREPKPAVDPAGGGSPSVDMPKPAGSGRIVLSDEDHHPEESYVGTNYPAGSGRNLPSGPLIGGPAGVSSPEDDKPPRKRHSNCPLCLSLDAHVCYACNACLWQENHGDERSA